MKNLSAAAFFGVMALVLWLLSYRTPREEPLHDPWQELVQQLDGESNAIDEKIARWRRFKAVRDEVHRAVALEGLPLPTAAEKVVSAARTHYPEFLKIAEIFAGQAPGGSDVTNVARLMIIGFAEEILFCGNRNRLDPQLLDRLEDELMQMTASRHPCRT